MVGFILLDDNGGMVFNNRRQSRDSAIVEDIVKMAFNSTLFCDEYSSKLFENTDIKIEISNDPVDITTNDGYMLYEKVNPLKYINKLDTIVIYRWNRVYPADLKIEEKEVLSGFVKKEVNEFAGSSHEKITKEVWTK